MALQVCKLRKADECNLELSRDYIASINEENDRLRAENAALKRKVEYTTLVMSHLNTKLKSMDEEKQSLVVALRILQEKEITKDSGNQKSVFTKVQAKSSEQHFPDISKSVVPSPLNNTNILQHNNTYDILTIEDHNETIVDDDQEITREISNTQQVAVGNDGRFIVNGQSKEDGLQDTKKATVSQPTEKVNVTANSECSEENGSRSNRTPKQYSLKPGSHMSPMVGDLLLVVIRGENLQRILHISDH